MLLNRGNPVIGLLDLSTGSTTGTIAEPRLIFCTALKGNACGIIVAHHHPSGNLSARQADIALTNKLKGAGKFLEIQLLDHIIITADSNTSKCWLTNELPWVKMFARSTFNNQCFFNVGINEWNKGIIVRKVIRLAS
jgi:hypothetical protein